MLLNHLRIIPARYDSSSVR